LETAYSGEWYSHPLHGLNLRYYALGLRVRTPSPFSPAGRNSTPALLRVFSMAFIVLTREFDLTLLQPGDGIQ
jgi:hypothetical protein